MPAKLSVRSLILILWLAFSIFYIGYNEWSRIQVFVMRRSYDQGMSDAVARVIEESRACKAFPVNAGEQKATLVNVECLKQPEQPKAEEKK